MPKRTKEILNKINTQAKKKFGQNFIIDKNILTNIVNSADVDKNDVVLEIGPGIGFLTEEIAQASNKVISYEIDQDLVNYLKENFIFDNVEFVEGDFLKNDLSELNNYKDLKVIANLPYYITSPLIFKLIHSNLDIKSMTLMVQKEVGDRITSSTGSKDYSELSVAVQIISDVRKVFDVSSKSFMPAPKVDSSIIEIKPINNTFYSENIDDVFLLLRSSFRYRRKTLINNLNNSEFSKKFNFSKEQINTMLEKLEILPSVRPEELSVETYKKMAKEFIS